MKRIIGLIGALILFCVIQSSAFAQHTAAQATAMKAQAQKDYGNFQFYNTNVAIPDWNYMVNQGNFLMPPKPTPNPWSMTQVMQYNSYITAGNMANQSAITNAQAVVTALQSYSTNIKTGDSLFTDGNYEAAWYWYSQADLNALEAYSSLISQDSFTVTAGQKYHDANVYWASN